MCIFGICLGLKYTTFCPSFWPSVYVQDGVKSPLYIFGEMVKDEATIYASERPYEQFEGVGGIIYHLGKKHTTKRLVGASNGAR